MLAREKWQILTIKVLELIFDERSFQRKKHGEAMRTLPDGTGPDVNWLRPANSTTPATHVEKLFREDYEEATERGELTRMHLVREELAEAFELDGDDPNFIGEAIQVAALLVQWVEYKLEAQEPEPRGTLGWKLARENSSASS